MIKIQCTECMILVATNTCKSLIEGARDAWLNARQLGTCNFCWQLMAYTNSGYLVITSTTFTLRYGSSIYINIMLIHVQLSDLRGDYEALLWTITILKNEATPTNTAGSKS